MVVIPYVEGVSEKIKRIYSKHNIHTAMRPTNTLKSILVHPKDKREITDSSDVVYDIPCGGCEKSYIGETGRQFRIRLKKHQKDVEKIEDITFTRAARKASTSEQHKSAITDHVAQANQIIDWEKARILDRDSNQYSRKIRESIEIRKKGGHDNQPWRRSLYSRSCLWFTAQINFTSWEGDYHNRQISRPKQWTKALVIKPSDKMAKAKVCE